MKKKLIFITEALWIGGIETALVNLLNRLDRERYDVTCLILRDERETASRITAECRLLVADRHHTVSFEKPYRYARMYDLMEEPQHASRVRRLVWRALRLALRAPEARRYSAYIKDQLGGEHFDTAIIYSDRAAEYAVRAVNADRFLMFYHHGAMRREYHDTFGYRRAEKIIAVSEALAEKLRAFRPAYAEKIIAINNLTDADGVLEKSLEAPQQVFPRDSFNIVSCGRLSPAKGMDLAVDACALLVRRGVTGFHWWIVGGGPEEAALRERAERLGVRDTVTLLGMRENPYPYIRQADLYVQPSRFEAYGLTIAEAMILNVPILSTDTDGARVLLTDGVSGALCAADAGSIADGVMRLIADPERRAGYVRYLKEHSPESENSAILEKLRGLF